MRITSCIIEPAVGKKNHRHAGAHEVKMSQCLRGILEPARVRYVKKLQLIGLQDLDNPYREENESRFCDNMTLWPPVEYGHIFSYFVMRPGLYTREQLLAWKQLDSYNYFRSGYVRTNLAWNSVCLLKTLVNPRQKSPDNVHCCWIAVKEDGTIISAHCTCMAG